MNQWRKSEPYFIGIYILVISTITLGWRVVRQERAIGALVTRSSEISNELAIAEMERRGFRNALMAMDLGTGTILRGFDVVAGRDFELHGANRTIVLVVDSRCPHSPQGISTLSEFRSRLPDDITVAIVSLADDEGDARIFAESNEIDVPLIVRPDGDLLTVLPRHATPLTIVLQQGRVVSYITGGDQEAGLSGVFPATK